MAGTIARTPCPDCDEVGGLYIDTVLVAGQIGDHSLAGNQIKVSARAQPILRCSKCDFSLLGEFDGDSVVFNPQ